MKFSINPQIFEKWPNAKLGVVLIFGMNNSKQNDEILKLMQNQTEKCKEFAGQDLKSLPFISCWREAYRVFGASPKKYPSSVEALVERTSKGGKLPNINSLVNLYNYLSLKYLLPFGGEDLDEIKGNVELAFAKGDEKGKYIGSDKEEAALPQEVVYKDDAGFICRRWNWREADRTKFTDNTKNAVLVAEIISPEFEKQLQDGINELAKLIEKHLGGKVNIYFLDKNNPVIDFDFQPQSKAKKVQTIKDTEKVNTVEEKKQEKKIFIPLKDSFAEKLQNIVWETVKDNIAKEEIFVEHPEVESFGDYSCNVAMRLAKQLKKNPMEIAQKIKENLEHRTENLAEIERIEVKAPGFINFWIKKEALFDILQKDFEFPKTAKRVMVEFTDPNPFKEFHIGHLYSNTVGEVLSRLFEITGATVWRVNYQGDVGMHVAKSIWGMKKKMTEEKVDMNGLEKRSLEERQKFMGKAYADGATAYEDDEKAKEEMNQLNKKIYEHDLQTEDLYQKGRAWSLEYFEKIYQRLGMKSRKEEKCFDNYYFESEVGKTGLELVKKYLGKSIFEMSDGAIIFPGKKYGLHNRVFINSLGLPTYETKELGLAPAKFKDFPYDLSVIVTGNEINEYFKVLMRALSLIEPDLAKKTVHIGHGMVRLPEGKMSSRTGKIITGEWLLDEVKQKVKEEYKNDEETAEKISLAAIKWALLKNGIGRDVIFDLSKSIAVEGNSGPYLQYTCVRTQSVLTKIPNSKNPNSNNNLNSKLEILNPEELLLLRTLYKFPEVVQSAAQNYSPNLICNFLFDLAQKFNNFYAKHRIIEGEQVNELRLFLTQKTGEVLKHGMEILNLPVVEKM